MRSLRSLGGAPTILLTLNTLALSQATADIVGRVTDASGAVLPAVTVTAENKFGVKHRAHWRRYR